MNKERKKESEKEVRPIKDMEKLTDALGFLKMADDVLYVTSLINLTYGLSFSKILSLEDSDVDREGNIKNCEFNLLPIFKEECREALKEYCGSRHDKPVGPYLFSSKGISPGNLGNMSSKISSISSIEYDEELSLRLINITYGYWYLKTFGTLSGSSYKSLMYRKSMIKQTFDLSEEEYEDLLSETWCPVLTDKFKNYISEITDCIISASEDIESEDISRVNRGNEFLSDLFMLIENYKDKQRVVSSEISRLASKIQIKDANNMDTGRDREALIGLITKEGIKAQKTEKYSYGELNDRALKLLREVKEDFDFLVTEGFSEPIKEGFSEKVWKLGMIVMDMADGEPESLDWIKGIDGACQSINKSAEPQKAYEEQGKKLLLYVDEALQSKDKGKCAVANALLMWLYNNLKYI